MAELSRHRDWIFDFVTMVAVLIGLTFGAIELRQMRNAQEAQAALELFQTIQTEGYTRGTGLIFQLPDTISPEALRAMSSTAEGELMFQVRLTYEALGVMVYRGEVSIDWVDELFRFMILDSWDKFEEFTLEERERLGYPEAMEWHQWLAERLRERERIGDAPAYEAYRDWKPDA